MPYIMENETCLKPPTSRAASKKLPVSPPASKPTPEPRPGKNPAFHLTIWR